VVTPLSPTGWSLIFDGETVSLYPSIGNWNFPCRSQRLDRRSSTPPPEVPAGRFGAETAWWAVETARAVIVEFYRAAGRELPSWI